MKASNISVGLTGVRSDALGFSVVVLVLVADWWVVKKNFLYRPRGGGLFRLFLQDQHRNAGCQNREECGVSFAQGPC